jgi:uncharacterized surface protein with fasciclin (FAS1) repeats
MFVGVLLQAAGQNHLAFAQGTSNEFTLSQPAANSGGLVCGAKGGETIASKIASLSELGLLAKAVNATGFDVTLSGPGPMTFLAPTDDAFKSLGSRYAATSASLLDMDLYDLLQYHILAGQAIQSSVQLDDTSSDMSMSSNGGEDAPLNLVLNSTGAYVNGEAKVVKEIQTCNGEILVIDTVLLPPLQLSNSKANDQQDCEPGHCCDLQPPGDFGCDEQVNRFDKCGEEWMVTGGFCRKSCGRCSIKAMQNASITHDPSTAFVHDGILYQQWRYLGDSGRISSLDRSRFMKSKPDYEEVLTKHFQGPDPVSGYGSSGARMTGWFCAPQDGQYEFYLSSDDSSRLYVQQEPGDLEMEDIGRSSNIVAQIDGWKRRSQWEKGRQKRYFFEGENYFFEVHHKNGGGEGHIKLGVKLPDGTYKNPIPASFFTKDCAPKKKMMEEETSQAEYSSDQEMGEEESGVCACTRDGMVQSVIADDTSSKVNTGAPGCRLYASSEPIDRFGVFGQQMGERMGDYLHEEWGWSPTTGSLLAEWWSSGAAAAAYNPSGLTLTTQTKICYVENPATCPVAQESAQFAGAAYKVCG